MDCPIAGGARDRRRARSLATPSDGNVVTEIRTFVPPRRNAAREILRYVTDEI